MTAEISRPLGDRFHLHFVWQIPEGDYLRAIFAADIVARDEATDRYIVLLAALTAARQEDSTGAAVPEEQLSQTYWPLVKGLIGRKTAVAYETADGRPVRLRLNTLTLEHSFFTRFNE